MAAKRPTGKGGAKAAPSQLGSAEQEHALRKAMAEAEEALAKNPALSNDPALPIYRVIAVERLKAERSRFEAGDRMALLGAIRICANHDLPLPDWASRAYIRAYDDVLTCRAGSWDAVFGKPYSGRHLRKLKQRRELRIAVLNEINRRLATVPPPPIDVGLFESVGQQFGIGATLCGELYYSARLPLPANSEN